MQADGLRPLRGPTASRNAENRIENIRKRRKEEADWHLER